MRPGRFALPLICLAVLWGACAPTGAAAASTPVGTAPELPAGASFAGAVAPERQLHLEVALEPRDPAALESFATEVSTPGSPIYGDYLSVPQFAARFGATPAQVATVRTALAAEGLEVGAVAANSLSIPITATAAEAEAAFATSISRVETDTGRLAYANRGAPRLPAGAAPYVVGVLGLDNLSQLHAEEVTEASAAASPAATDPATGGSTAAVLTGGPQPCKEIAGVGERSTENTAPEIASAYGLSGYYAAGDFGAGQTIALEEFQPYGEADIAAYQACYGTHTEVVPFNVLGGPSAFNGTNDGESALDIEQIIGLAPAARIIVYQGPNPSEYPVLTAWVTQNVAKVMSSSWGICESHVRGPEMVSTETLLQEAAAQGQSFFSAAGDNGSTDCYEPPDRDESLAVDFPSAEPFATSVGGTEMTEPTTPPKEYIWDLEPTEGAGGGGVSRHFAMPSYQLSAAPSLNVIGPLSSGSRCGSPTYCREVPDVSADAAPRTGYIVHVEEEWAVIGGTSAAAPLWAALAGLANASAACAGHSIGFANPALYAVGGTSYAGNFNDVTAAHLGGRPTTNPFSLTEPYAAGPGFDMATGIGTPIGSSLGTLLCELAPIPAPPPPPPPAPTPSPPSRPRLVRAQLVGLAKGRPHLEVVIAAREGARIGNLTVTLPRGISATRQELALRAGMAGHDEAGKVLKLKPHATARTIQIGLASPKPTIRLRIGAPALAPTPRLVARVRGGKVAELSFLVAVREAGVAGGGERFPLALKP